jgi:hypothetical protein
VGLQGVGWWWAGLGLAVLAVGVVSVVRVLSTRGPTARPGGLVVLIVLNAALFGALFGAFAAGAVTDDAPECTSQGRADTCSERAAE